MNYKLWFRISLGMWLALVLGLGLMVVRGTAHLDEDGRQAVVLTPGQRDLVLAEMRGLLAGVASIQDGLASGNMAQVAHAAERIGTAHMADLDPTLMARLPLGFKKRGRNIHVRFDQLAGLAAQGDSKAVHRHLADTLAGCVECHGGFKLEAH